jgi:peptide/nickel transport system substrate-binding protein
MKRRPLFLALLSLALSCSRQRELSVPDSHIRIAQITSATSLDPYLQDDERTYSTLDHFYNKLVSFGPELQVQPELAVRWENLSDTVWRFHLRPGVKFHDGRPFGAQDVVTSIRRAQAAPGSQVNYYVQSIREVRAVDDATVVMVTRDPNSVLLNKLVYIAIVPRDTPLSPIVQPIGTGPYRFVAGKAGAAVEGERFERFWGPRPYFRRVSILPFPGIRERADAVPSGVADIAARFPEEFWEWGRQRKNIRTVYRQGISETLLGFSLKPPSPFADVRVRRAVALSIDRGELVRKALKGLGVPLDQLVPSTVFGFSSQLKPMAHDPALARRLLAEAGFPTGFDTPLYCPDYLENAAQEIAAELLTVGIHVHPASSSFAAFNARWAQSDLPVAIFGWGAGTGDISDFLDALLHSPSNGFGKANHFFYSNEKLDRLIEQSDRTLDPAGRHEILVAAQEIVRDDLPILPLVLRFDLYAVRDGLEWTPRPDRRVRAFDIRPSREP